jgi:hypothetical protein
MVRERVVQNEETIDFCAVVVVEELVLMVLDRGAFVIQPANSKAAIDTATTPAKFRFMLGILGRI